MMFNLSGWRRRMAVWTPSSRHAARRRPASTRLLLERLEDRVTPSGGVQVEYAAVQDWGTGLQAQVRLDNPQPLPVPSWTLEFDYAGAISSLWDGVVAGHVGTHYTVTGAAWNRDLPAGGAVSFGFIAAPGGTAAPTNYLLNGVPLDGTPGPTLPALTAGDATATRSTSGTTTITFPVQLSAPAAAPVLVSWATADGTARAGTDYQAAGGTLRFDPGEVSKTVGVTANPGTPGGPTLTFRLQLSAPNGATLARDTAVGTLASPALPSGDVQFRVESDWGSGFTGTVTARNSGPAALNDWTLAFDFAGELSSVWNATVVSHVGSRYVVAGADWNRTIAPGGTVSFGFVASPGHVTVGPTNFVLSGAGGSTNRPPQAGADLAVTATGTPVTLAVLANDSDPDGDALAISSFTQADHGTVAAAAGGRLTYTPAAGYTGADAFTYVVADGRGGTAGGRVSVTVTGTTTSAWPAQFFAPYVDVTLYPTFDLVNAAQVHGVKYATLAFVVADGQHRPSWGGYEAYAVNGSEFDLALRAQVSTLRSLGGDVIVSFGGANGQELAQVETDVGALTRAYSSVVSAYGLTRIDFDVEGAAAADRASIDRRSQAVAALQREAAAAGRTLQVTFTLPVLPTGLTPDGLNVLRSALNFGVVIGGVNIMAMDYGDGAAPSPQGQMGTYAIEAATSLFHQLQGLYGAALSDAALWHLVGVTPMIGRNDVVTEVFDQAAARQLVAFANEVGLGWLSMWSLNRDRQDPAGVLAYASPTSSSILQQPFEFAQIFQAVED